MLIIRKALVGDIPILRRMADVVFRQTYSSILTPDQIDYMMDWMYSEESLHHQICDSGKEFFIAFDSDVPAGYVSYEHEAVLEDGRNLYHLQKLYVMPEFQHCGIGSGMLDFVRRTLRETNSGGCRIELNVNRNNPAVGFYERSGLSLVRSGDFPIGDGFYMNDYIFGENL